MKSGKKKVKIIIAALCVTVCIAGAGIISYENASAADAEIVYKETTAKRGTLMTGVTESGSVTVGTVSQEIDYENLSGSSSSNTMGMMNTSSNSSGSSSASLEVEEIYVTVGQYVTEGTPILKISDESIEDYRSELQEEVTSASTSLSEVQVSSAKQQLSADYSYNSTVANGSVAEANYNATIKELQDAIDEAQEALEEQYETYHFYLNLVNEGYTENEEALEEAGKQYEKLQAQLIKAQNNYTTKSIEAKKTYEEAMLNYSNADAQYSVDINGVSSDLSDAKDTLSDAKEELEQFNDFVGDGIIYAKYSGMITELGYEEGDTLSSSIAIASYTDSTSVTMTVSASEEDISDIAVGDAVSISLNAYEDEYFDGTVTGMDTTSSSGSSTVSYDVTVLFNGDTSKVYADMTGNVTFYDEQVTDVIYVSQKAIITDSDNTYVDIKREDGTIERVQVITGFTDGVNIEIQSGVEEGDTVLIESQVAAS